MVWFYAPGYIGEHKFEPSQMEELTGFTFKRMDAPGPMMIRCKIEENELKFFREFGVQKPQYPRFAVVPREGEAIRIHGTWSDSEEIAFASKEYDGFTSIYVGTGPMPVELLRWIAGRAGVKLWSSKTGQRAGHDRTQQCSSRPMKVSGSSGCRIRWFPWREVLRQPSTGFRCSSGK